MKLLRFGAAGQERPGLLADDGTVRDLSQIVDDIAGDVLLPERLTALSDVNIESLPVIDNSVRLGPCVGWVGKILGVGLNYSDHARESGMAIPTEPVLFGKPGSTINGPNDPVIIPRGSEKTDWEVELGIVIGKPAKHIDITQAADHIAGYCIVNDVSERTLQLEGTGQWIKGKCCDTFAPIGPWLVTADETGDPCQLDLWLEVDGVRYQNGNTGNMIFNVYELVSYISQLCTLHPGDIISTGTPAGVGLGQKPPVYLRPGQTMKLGIEGLGIQQQSLIAEV